MTVEATYLFLPELIEQLYLVSRGGDPIEKIRWFRKAQKSAIGKGGRKIVVYENILLFYSMNGLGVSWWNSA